MGQRVQILYPKEAEKSALRFFKVPGQAFFSFSFLILPLVISESPGTSLARESRPGTEDQDVSLSQNGREEDSETWGGRRLFCHPASKGKKEQQVPKDRNLIIIYDNISQRIS